MHSSRHQNHHRRDSSVSPKSNGNYILRCSRKSSVSPHFPTPKNTHTPPHHAVTKSLQTARRESSVRVCERRSPICCKPHPTHSLISVLHTLCFTQDSPLITPITVTFTQGGLYTHHHIHINQWKSQLHNSAAVYYFCFAVEHI